LNPAEYSVAAGLFKQDIAVLGRDRVVTTKPLGLKRLMRISFTHRPKRPRRVERKKRPKCHASTEDARKKHDENYKRYASTFASASKEFRAGNFDVEFPKNAFRPPVPPWEVD
ncbi:MAG: hypothetical protein AAFY60_09860, partial [Myxococcota bacterium]